MSEEESVSTPWSYLIDLGTQSYPVYVGMGLLGKVGPLVKSKLSDVERCAVVTSKPIMEIHGEALLRSFRNAGIKEGKVLVPDGEEAKSWFVAEELVGELLELGLDRKSVVIAFGGGAVGDLAGFVSSIYLRGVNLVQVPSTLLAQVDSSLGGKTAINHPKGKNLIGSFHQPSLVISDPSILHTLPKEELLSGLGEVVKHSVIADSTLFKFIEEKASSITQKKLSNLVYLIKRSIAIKGELVVVDEMDNKGIRAILNYGHTTGHALEILSGHQLRHGEAVALGMIVASRISNSLGLIPNQDIERQRILLEVLGFNMTPPKLDSTKIVEIMYRDKKTVGESIRFVLPTGIGRTPILRPVSNRLITQSLEDEGYG